MFHKILRSSQQNNFKLNIISVDKFTFLDDSFKFRIFSFEDGKISYSKDKSIMGCGKGDWTVSSFSTSNKLMLTDSCCHFFKNLFAHDLKNLTIFFWY